ncbi:MAG: hypothetical protein LE168_00490 [Endomicrobium sp.]|nr:hypothetical protein [Endomicrobium sp.]
MYDESIVGLTIFFVIILLVFVVGYKNMLFLRSSKDGCSEPMLYMQFGAISAFASQLAHDCVCVSLRFVSSGCVFWLMIWITLAIGANLVKENNIALKDYLKKPLKIFLQMIMVASFCVAMVYIYI